MGVLPECLCTMYVPGVRSGQKRAMGSLGLEFERVVSHHSTLLFEEGSIVESGAHQFHKTTCLVSIRDAPMLTVSC